MSQLMPFRPRAREVSRLEAFSDVVFGFALTLIVVSLEVPRTYEELTREMRGFVGFAICFATLTWVWHEHHKFFRRYGLTDHVTLVLNTMLLFLVLFYIYPLKFMFELVTGRISGAGTSARELFLIYGLGFCGIFAVFLLMNAHAWRKRDELELNAVERHDTITAICMYGGWVAVGVVSIVVAQWIPLRTIGIAGWIYAALGPVSATIGYTRGSARYRLAQTVLAGASGAPLPAVTAAATAES